MLGVSATELLDAGVSPAEVAFWRAAIGAAWFIVHALVTGRRAEGPNLVPHVLLGLVGVAVFYTALPAAIEAGGIGLAWVLLYTAPGFVMLAGWLSGRRPGLVSIAILCTLVVGVALVVGGGDGDDVGVAVAWGLMSGATYALHYLIGSSPWAGDPIARYAVALGVAAIVLVPFVDWADKNTTQWWWVASIGTVSTYVPFLALGTALRTADPGRAAVVASLEPVLASVLAVVVYGEVFGPNRVVGAFLVVTAAAFAAVGFERSTSSSAVSAEELHADPEREHRYPDK